MEEHENGANATEDEPLVGPGPAPRARPKRPLQFEQAYLDALPSANMSVTTAPNIFLLLLRDTNTLVLELGFPFVLSIRKFMKLDTVAFSL